MNRAAAAATAQAIDNQEETLRATKLITTTDACAVLKPYLCVRIYELEHFL